MVLLVPYTKTTSRTTPGPPPAGAGGDLVVVLGFLGMVLVVLEVVLRDP